MEEHNTMRSPPTHSKGHPILEVLSVLGQFTRNYTQTVKRTADNKIKAEHQAQESARCSACFVVRGFQRGLPLGTLLCNAKCSVLYALSALPWKCRCRRGGHGNLKRQENRAVIAWRKAASAGLFSSADRAYMKAPIPRPTLRPVDKDFLLITL